MSFAALVTEYSQTFGIKSEARAASEMKKLLAEDRDVSSEFEDHALDQHVAVAENLYRQCIAAGEYTAAAQVLKIIGSVKKIDQPQRVEVNVGFSAEMTANVRARIAQLSRNGRVRDNAEVAGVDLPALAEAAGHALPDVIDAEIVEETRVEQPAPRLCHPLDQHKPALLPLEPTPLPAPPKEVVPEEPRRDESAPHVSAFAEKLGRAREKAESLK